MGVIKMSIGDREIICDNDFTLTITRQPIGEVELPECELAQLPKDEWFEMDYQGITFDARL